MSSPSSNDYNELCKEVSSTIINPLFSLPSSRSLCTSLKDLSPQEIWKKIKDDKSISSDALKKARNICNSVDKYPECENINNIPKNYCKFNWNICDIIAETKKKGDNKGLWIGLGIGGGVLILAIILFIAFSHKKKVGSPSSSLPSST